MRKLLYLKVTEDKYELPIAVAESQAELARMLGLKLNTVNCAYHFVRSGKYKNSSYKVVEVDDDGID